MEAAAARAGTTSQNLLGDHNHLDAACAPMTRLRPPREGASQEDVTGDEKEEEDRPRLAAGEVPFPPTWPQRHGFQCDLQLHPPSPPPPHTRPTTRFPLPICRETIAALRTASVKHELVLRQRFDLPHITLVTCHGRETRGGKSTADFVRVILGDCLTAMRNSTCLPLPVLHR